MAKLRTEAGGCYSWSNGPGDRYAAHSHSFEKILYCVSGSITFTLRVSRTASAVSPVLYANCVTSSPCPWRDRIQPWRETVIVIGSLPPGGLAHTRYLCKRIARQFPDARLVVGRWGLAGEVLSGPANAGRSSTRLHRSEEPALSLPKGR